MLALCLIAGLTQMDHDAWLLMWILETDSGSHVC